MSSLRVIDTPLTFGALAAAGVGGTAPRGWYTGIPTTSDEWRTRVTQTVRTDGAWLDRLRPALGNGARLLDRVVAGKGVVVTTGQQPGLFGGPLYTWHKALSALETAAAIERTLGVPAVPVFWAATDDADFTEGASTVIATETGARTLTLTTRPADGVPMSHAPLGKEIADAVFELESAAGSGADPRALHATRGFKAGVTLGDAYVAMLRDLLEPLGIAVLDASHECVAAASRESLEQALTKSAAVHDAVVARTDAARAAGFETTVDVDRALTMVFAWELGADGVPHKRRLTVEEANDFVGSSVRLSPNVLLRPVVERHLLPTVAYLAGPGEFAYFAQVSAVADALGAAQPLAIPRWSGMALPNETAETLSALNLQIDDLRDPHAAEGILARAALSADASAVLVNLRHAIDENLPKLTGALTDEAREGAKNQLTLRVDKLERRLVAAAKHRESATMRKIAAARAVLYPFGKAQERALNVVPLWSKYGDEWVNAVRAACAAHAERCVRGSVVTT